MQDRKAQVTLLMPGGRSPRDPIRAIASSPRLPSCAQLRDRSKFWYMLVSEPHLPREVATPFFSGILAGPKGRGRLVTTSIGPEQAMDILLD